MTNLTKILTGQFHGANYVVQPALRRTAFFEDVFSQNWCHIGRGRGRRSDRRRPTFPQKQLSPSDRGIATRGRVNFDVASAAFCLHRKHRVSQPSFTLKCAAFQ
jgi:hypothetical protein